jgi:hypothetical protein
MVGSTAVGSTSGISVAVGSSSGSIVASDSGCSVTGVAPLQAVTRNPKTRMNISQFLKILILFILVSLFSTAARTGCRLRVVEYYFTKVERGVRKSSASIFQHPSHLLLRRFVLPGLARPHSAHPEEQINGQLIQLLVL